MLTTNQRINALKKHLQQECGFVPTTKWAAAHLDEFQIEDDGVASVPPYEENSLANQEPEKPDHIQEYEVVYCNLTERDKAKLYLQALQIFLYLAGKTQKLPDETNLPFTLIQEKLRKIYPAIVPIEKDVRKLQQDSILKKRILFKQYQAILPQLKLFYSYRNSPKGTQLRLF